MDDEWQWVCLTPTRNENWIIRPFLGAAKYWANHIIVADQGSTDGTLEELVATPGIDALINDSPTFDERHRQKLLINRAREINGKRILVALDADEALSANCLQSKEWEQIEAAKPGTVLRFRWANVLPGFETVWLPDEPTPFGFVDDGSGHTELDRIHNPRLPCPVGAPVLDLEEIVVLHFQYVVWERMLSKQRWYQAWEHINNPDKGPLRIYRQYNHMLGGWKKSEIHPLRPEWLAAYDLEEIDFRTLKSEPVTWWDQQILEWLRNLGPDHFRKIAIWDKNWNEVGDQLNGRSTELQDPRSVFEKLAHNLLRATQDKRTNLGVRLFERMLRTAGW